MFQNVIFIHFGPIGTNPDTSPTLFRLFLKKSYFWPTGGHFWPYGISPRADFTKNLNIEKSSKTPIFLPSKKPLGRLDTIAPSQWPKGRFLLCFWEKCPPELTEQLHSLSLLFLKIEMLTPGLVPLDPGRDSVQNAGSFVSVALIWGKIHFWKSGFCEQTFFGSPSQKTSFEVCPSTAGIN